MYKHHVLSGKASNRAKSVDRLGLGRPPKDTTDHGQWFTEPSNHFHLSLPRGRHPFRFLLLACEILPRLTPQFYWNIQCTGHPRNRPIFVRPDSTRKGVSE